jgi:hypothetical protein
MEQVSFQKGSAALRSCRRNVTAGASRSVDIARVATDGDSAEALFTPQGGTLDGQRVTVALRKDAGRWKLDRITKFDLVNRPRFDDAVRSGLRAPPLDMPLKQADCIVAGLARRSDDQIESAFIKADATLFAEPVVRCSLAFGLEKGGLTTGQSSCVVKGLERRVPPLEVAQLFGVNLGPKRDVSKGYTVAGDVFTRCVLVPVMRREGLRASQASCVGRGLRRQFGFDRVAHALLTEDKRAEKAFDNEMKRLGAACANA